MGAGRCTERHLGQGFRERGEPPVMGLGMGRGKPCDRHQQIALGRKPEALAFAVPWVPYVHARGGFRALSPRQAASEAHPDEGVDQIGVRVREVVLRHHQRQDKHACVVVAQVLDATPEHLLVGEGRCGGEKGMVCCGVERVREPVVVPHHLHESVHVRGIEQAMDRQGTGHMDHGRHLGRRGGKGKRRPGEGALSKNVQERGAQAGVTPRRRAGRCDPRSDRL